MATYAAFTLSGEECDKFDEPNKPRKERTMTYDCPVCMEYLLPPIFQCYNGHTLCNVCEPQLTTCPVCRDDLPTPRKSRNLVLEDIVQGSLFDCKNYEQGCLVSLKYHQIEAHTWDCLFMELPICSHLGIKCDGKYTSKTILKHLKSAHAILGINFQELAQNNEETFESVPIEICQTASIFRLERSTETAVKPHYFIFRGNLLFLTTTYRDRALSWTVSLLGSSKLAGQFVAKIKLMPKDSGVTSMEWQGLVSQLKNEKPDPTNQAPEIFNFSIPLRKLEMLCKSRGNPAKETACTTKQNEDLLNWRLHLNLAQLKENEDDSKFAWSPKAAGVVMDTEFLYDGHPLVHNNSNGIRGRPGVWIQKDFAEQQASLEPVSLPGPSSGPRSSMGPAAAAAFAHTTLSHLRKPETSLQQMLRRETRLVNDAPNFNSFTGFYEEAPTAPVRTGYLYFQD